jgi:hypothetical protein
MSTNNDLEKRLWAAADQLRTNSSLMVRGRLLLGLILVLFGVSSCMNLEWKNPVSPVEETECDNGLPGAWQITDPETGKQMEVLWIGGCQDGWMSFAAVSGAAEKVFGKMYVSRLNGRAFLNCKDVVTGKEVSENYRILEYQVKMKKLWLYQPDEGIVKKALEENELLGEKVGDGGILIDSSSKQIQEFIGRYPREKLFRSLLDKPAYLEKVR